jgi:hypothetical protein
MPWLWLIVRSSNCSSSYFCPRVPDSCVSHQIPAAALQNLYDPRDRSWYQQAAIDRQNATYTSMTVPYLDASTNLKVVTFARPIINAGSANDTKLFGVAGMDFLLSTVRQWFSSAVQCPSQTLCFVIDRGGYMLLDPYDDNFVLNAPNPVFFGTRDQNLASLANAMLRDGALIKTRCNDFSTITVTSFYKVNVPSTKTGTLYCTQGTETSAPPYVVTRVPRTSFFLVALSTASSLPPISTCCNQVCPMGLTDDTGARFLYGLRSVLFSSLSFAVCDVPCSSPMRLVTPCSSHFTEPL